MSQTVPGRDSRQGGAGTVLVVDDEPIICTLVSRFLGSAGYAVVAAASGRAAQALLAGTQRFDLLVTDLAMPGFDGAQLIAWARAEQPSLPILCMTGHAEGVPAGVPVLDKPFRGPTFLEAVRAAIGHQPEPASI
jgi:CheY-like chemotaxis protein